MKYENAKDILPASLLREVQKYAEGKAIYIPKRERSKGWGEASGYREKLNKRNALICSR
nr:CD3324 family protein [uncultured Butyrivibrio sp.]